MPRTTIDKNQPILTVINEFHVTREQQKRVADRFPTLMSDVVSRVPGFISGNLHLSIDGERVLTYYQWESQEAYDAFLADTATASKVADVIAEYGADRRIYEVVFQVWGTEAESQAGDR